jgi:lipoprotein-anchoring transpeptidase ErfK/SrfK
MIKKASIEISIEDQKLRVFNGDILSEYSISTAKLGVGTKKGSFKTPLGLHQVRAKIGSGLPLNSVFLARRPTGEIYTASLAKQFPKRDWILSRILWLSGCEVGHNRLGDVDTMQRYIYIHGTPDTEPMGKPESHGCVRMRNTDVVEVFDTLQIGSLVWIQEPRFEGVTCRFV